jgi:hypothetical protein
MATIIAASILQSTPEIRKWVVDFTDDLLAGVTVSSAVATHTPPSGAATSPTVSTSTPYVTVTLGPLAVTGVHYLDVLATLSNSEMSEVRIVAPVGHLAPTARPTLLTLIGELRQMTDAGPADYTLAGVTYWTDAHLQAALDRHRVDLYREPLTALETHVGGGTVHWLDYQSGYGHLEETSGGTAIFVVEDSTGVDQGTASWSADYARGRITFSQNQGGTAYYLTARSYDLNAAAADVWRTKAAQSAKLYHVSTDNHSLSREQIFAHALQMADYYAGRAAPALTDLYRSDSL